MTADVIPLRADQAPQAWELVDAGELARLRQMQADLARPVVELARDLAHARRVREEAERFIETVDLRRVAGWHKVPRPDLERLRSVLEEER